MLLQCGQSVASSLKIIFYFMSQLSDSRRIMMNIMRFLFDDEQTGFHLSLCECELSQRMK
jgi:hypothetical protein